MITSSIPTVATVEFQGAQLITIKKDDVELVAMKPISDGIGLNWQKQAEKLQRDKDKFNCTLMGMVAADGKQREMICMPITKLNGWLFSINPNKIPNQDVRKRVVEYQEECFIALYDYWHKGVAVRPQPETLTPSEQHEISQAVKLKAGDNSKAIPEIWGRIKNKFKVAKYSQIPRERFQEVIIYVSEMELRVTLKAEAKQEDQPVLQQSRSEEYYKNRIETIEDRAALYKENYEFYSRMYKDLLSIMIDMVKNRMARS